MPRGKGTYGTKKSVTPKKKKKVGAKGGRAGPKSRRY